MGTLDKPSVDYMLTVANVERNRSDESRASVPSGSTDARRASERRGFCRKGLNNRASCLGKGFVAGPHTAITAVLIPHGRRGRLP